MKFAKRFRSQIHQPWSAHYVKYKELKGVIKGGDHSAAQFLVLLQSQMDNVDEFFAKELNSLQGAFTDLSLDDLASGAVLSDDLRNVWERVQHLERFVVLNYFAVLKISKKYDKWTNNNNNNSGGGGNSAAAPCAEPAVMVSATAALRRRPFFLSGGVVEMKWRLRLVMHEIVPNMPPPKAAEFSCNLCSQILAKPEALSCGHLFCSQCLLPAPAPSSSSSSFSVEGSAPPQSLERRPLTCCPNCQKQHAEPIYAPSLTPLLAAFIEKAFGLERDPAAFPCLPSPNALAPANAMFAPLDHAGGDEDDDSDGGDDEVVKPKKVGCEGGGGGGQLVGGGGVKGREGSTTETMKETQREGGKEGEAGTGRSSLLLRVAGEKDDGGRYLIGEVLGRGAFGVVYKASVVQKRPPGGAAGTVEAVAREVALKVIDTTLISDGGVLKGVLREVDVLQGPVGKHPNVVSLLDAFYYGEPAAASSLIANDSGQGGGGSCSVSLVSPRKLCIVLELCEREMFDVLAEAGKFDTYKALVYFEQLVGAIAHCHAAGVAHRDLKLENILLDTSGNLKLTDFGLCAFDRGNALMCSTACGSPNYVAPEVFGAGGKKGRRGGGSGGAGSAAASPTSAAAAAVYDGAKADVWSCGIVLYTFLTGCLPFASANGGLAELVGYIKAGIYEQPADVPASVLALLAATIKVDVDTRLDSAQVHQRVKAMLADSKLAEMLQEMPALSNFGSGIMHI
jgi:serine/threonine protein kinase